MRFETDRQRTGQRGRPSERYCPRRAARSERALGSGGRLDLAGGEVLMKIYPGTVHGFLEADSIVGSRLALKDLGEFVSGQAGGVTR
jgi:hypothetical protein